MRRHSRYNTEILQKDLQKKIVLLSGPRQVGKTTLSKSLKATYEYLNWDEVSQRQLILAKKWNRATDLVILDELHKMKKWKSWLKGIYDSEGTTPPILVTGSARLDVLRKGGDSLAGRHFHHRLHPLSVAELRSAMAPQEALEKILRLGGFPEPLFGDSDEAAKRWRRSHVDRIVRDDLRDLAEVRDLQSIETLLDLLSYRTGSQISYQSLAEDLHVSPHSVKKWIQHLENLYLVFTVYPFHKNVARSIQKQPKVYFYDTARVMGDEGARLENAVACALHKYHHYLEDHKGEKAQLFYLRDRNKREVDFLSVINDVPERMIEVKTSDDATHPGLRYFKNIFKRTQAIQLVHRLKRELHDDGVQVKAAASWLGDLV